MGNRVRILALSTLGPIALAVLGVGPALAGGGCHQGVTTGDARGDGKTTVEMVDACFTPTTLQVDPGAEISFVNLDDVTHNVTANQWGHFDDMAQGDRFSVSFDAPGTYPFACTYHPGMAGAIIVGDGVGAGNGVNVVPLEAPNAVVTTAATTPGDSSGGWIVGGAVGLLVGVAAGIGLARVRRTAANA
jgi:plastocyanin